MLTTQGTLTIAVVSACMSAGGWPQFALNEVEVTKEEHSNGVHYERVEEKLAAAGYEEPYVHFDEREMPSFLLPAVQAHLGLPSGSAAFDHMILAEEP